MRRHIKFSGILSCLLLALILFSSYGCKKYEDGPLLSFEPKTTRLCGTWDVVYFEVNGFDSTETLKNNPNYAMYYFDVNNKKGRFAVSDGPTTRYGEWRFVNNKRSLALTLKTQDYLGNTLPDLSILGPYKAPVAIWDIRRLQDEYLWLTTNVSGKQYFVKFTKFRHL